MRAEGILVAMWLVGIAWAAGADLAGLDAAVAEVEGALVLPAPEGRP
jgi:hypothetical protein